MNINRTEFYDKVYGCWIGKSIGGTLGTPFEGKQELLDIKGFTSAPGKPLPNDDLDLQLIWLHALETVGPMGINERLLGEYWLNYIPPHWNEYGICKSNMRAGLLPPLSGNYENVWKDSNGAWIRSEIWACCTPGRPDLARNYAYSDACVDHGTAEGTYAELFTATVESAAFMETDPLKLIDIGLSYIPADCWIARSIKIVLDGYGAKEGWKEVRQRVLDDSADLGWFQAPANVAFTLIGWLYGKGDFKESLLIAVNCGDDTDCTGATLGSLLGIIGGYKAIPEDWVRFVGDDIISVAIDRGSVHTLPPTCTDLTDRTIQMAEQVLAAYKTGISISDAPTDIEAIPAEALYSREAAGKSAMDGAIVYEFIHTTARVTFPSGVRLRPGNMFEIHVELRNNMPGQQQGNIEYYLPEGVRGAELPRHVNLLTKTLYSEPVTEFTIRLEVEETASVVNRGVIQIVMDGRPTVILIPFLFYLE